MKWYADPKQLQRARKEVGLTQEALAKASGIKRSVIANIEIERRPFSSKAQKAIWKALARARSNQRLRAQALDAEMGGQIKFADLLPSSFEAFKRFLRRQHDERALHDALALIRLQDRQIAELRAEIVRLEKQKAALLEWLESEEEAALAHEKAAELKEQVSEKA